MSVRALMEGDINFLNDKHRESDFKINNHVMHPQRLRIVSQVKASWLLIADNPAQ
jgi:hypothetical protein